jgi:translation initiation factor IF-3
MEKLSITAVFKRVEDIKEVGEKKFRTRNLIVTTEDEQYPQTLAIQFTQDRVNAMDIFKPGDKVKIAINLKGREWTNPEGVPSVFNTIEGWKIEKAV